MATRTKNRLNCFCRFKPLLAMYGIDEKGRLYIHFKIFKGDRIFGEVVAYDGEVKFICRDCFRWHRVVLKGTVKMEETQIPSELRDI